MIKEPSFTIGVEEEYLLVDRDTRDLIKEAPPTMLPACERGLKGQVTPEFLQSQIEVGTRVCTNVKEVRENLSHLRSTVSHVANDHGLAMIAASTHPFAVWGTQKRTEKERYAVLAQDMQEVVRRLMICGMHVHVGIEDDDLRIDMLGQATYVLPHLLALSTSSPFWEGHDTGLMSYRIAVWNELPRTGLPEYFDSIAEYRRHVQALVSAGIIEDGTKLWWDLRPSARFPTLEMRVCDVCTRLEDAVSVAALYLCWLRLLYRLRLSNQRWRRYAPLLINENRWRAQRYGLDKGLLDFGRGSVVPYPQLLAEMLELIREDAEYFDCVSEVEHAQVILKRGTSAHWQRRTFDRAKAEGAGDKEALQQVVDMLTEETLRGI